MNIVGLQNVNKLDTVKASLRIFVLFNYFTPKICSSTKDDNCYLLKLQNLPVPHWAQNLSEFSHDLPQFEQNIV